MALLLTSRQMLPRPSHDLGYRLNTSRGSLSPIEFVSTCIYLLSNNLHDDRDDDNGIQLLCSLFEQHGQYLATLLQHQLRSAWAAWHSLLHYAMYKQQRNIFRFLIQIGKQNEWLHQFHGRIFSSAADMECFDIVKDIINPYVADPDISHACGWVVILDAILAACRKGEEKVARLIMRRCGINNADYVDCCKSSIKLRCRSSLALSSLSGTKMVGKQRWTYFFWREQMSTKFCLRPSATEN